MKSSRTDNFSARGFTLIELLTVVGIIGVLSSIGAVSYSSARSVARDARRLAAVRQIQAALEVFYDANGHYPADGLAGSLGLVLGGEGAAALTDAGFGDAGPAGGFSYLSTVPANPLPYGAPYVYRSLDGAGGDCEKGCRSYALLFWLERGYQEYDRGPHALAPLGAPTPTADYSAQPVAIGGSPDNLERLEGELDRLLGATSAVIKELREDATVRQVSERAVAPTAGALAALNVAFAAGSQLYHLMFFVLQPLQLARRRRPLAWGVVYNAVSRLPEDLAIVRLHDAVSRRILRSQVTDTGGRFSFLVDPGRYRLTVAKSGYVFPSALAAGVERDGPYGDVYHGGPFDVTEDGAAVTPNIPLDPPDAPASADAAEREVRRAGFRRGVAVFSLLLGLLAFALTPTAVTALILAAQAVVYLIFRRLSEPRAIKSWGLVLEQGSRRPVSRAVVRVFEAKYNKLLETQVTDRRGRYHFRVGRGVYYLTVTKPGYAKTETNKLDLTGREGATVIAADLPLVRDAAAGGPSAA
jgi:prepilin-type N-terminal cleavage/methylation domain-containing protein